MHSTEFILPRVGMAMSRLKWQCPAPSIAVSVVKATLAVSSKGKKMSPLLTASLVLGI